MSAFPLQGSNILLTGGTGEIGYGILEGLSKRDPKKIFLPSSQPEKLTKVKEKFPELPLVGIDCNLATEAGIDTLIKALNHTLASEALDLVIFGAGMLGINGKEAFPTWQNSLKTLALNALSPDVCFQKMLENKLLKKGSFILALGSIAGHKSYLGSENLSTYTLSKAALHQAVKNWAKNHPEMTIFEVALGAVQTKMLDDCRPPQMSTQEWHEALMHDIPIQEISQPRTVGETLLRLIENPGYRLFHGDTVHLSGGERL